MKSLVYLAQVFVGDMRIHLRRCDVGMAEEGLDTAEVVTVRVRNEAAVASQRALFEVLWNVAR